MERLAGFLEELFTLEKNQLYATLLAMFVADVTSVQNTATFIDKVCKSVYANTRNVVGLRVMTKSYIKIYGKSTNVKHDYSFQNIRSTVYFSGEDKQEDEFVKTCLFMADKIYNVIRKMENYQKLVSYDQLTGAYTRRVGLNILKAHIARSRRQNTDAFVIFIDLDDFKKYNDTYGHVEGDRLLSVFGDYIKSNLRQHDLFIRYGGDEFVLYLETPSPEVVLKRLLTDSPIRFSYGIVSIKESDNLKELLEIADRKMYDAKKRAKVSI